MYTAFNACHTQPAGSTFCAYNGRTIPWSAENQPLSVTQSSVTESYLSNADNERVKLTTTLPTTTTTTFYFGSLAEEIVVGNTATKRHAYTFNGQVIAQRDVPSSGASTVTYLHADHLGSIAATSTMNTSPTVTKQYFTPWGEARQGDLTSTTTRNYTGQRKDETGLLFYNARYYDPKLSRFISADSIVPGMASGTGGTGSVGVDDKTRSMLTVDFHEPGFAIGAGAENAFTREKGFKFELSGEDAQKAKSQDGPANPQALNRYAYVLNNPLRYTDPTGHDVYLSSEDVHNAAFAIRQLANNYSLWAGVVGTIVSGLGAVLVLLNKFGAVGASVATALGALSPEVALAILGIIAAGAAFGWTVESFYMNELADMIEHLDSGEGVALRRTRDTYWLDTIMVVDRSGKKGYASIKYPRVPDDYARGRILGSPRGGHCFFSPTIDDVATYGALIK